MAVHQIELDEDEDSFVREQVSQGKYESPADVLKAGLASLERALDDDAEWRAWLYAEAKIGFDQIESGQFITLASEAEIHQFMDDLGRKARGESSPG